MLIINVVARVHALLGTIVREGTDFVECSNGARQAIHAKIVLMIVCDRQKIDSLHRTKRKINENPNHDSRTYTAMCTHHHHTILHCKVL